MQRADVIVVGAGVMGAAAAWSLSRRGRDVVLLEQFERGHTRGSSHGASRIFRLAYPDPAWIDLARRAQQGWQVLEDETEGALVTGTGSVDTGDPAAVEEIRSALAAAAVDHELLDAAAAHARWPGIAFDGRALHQPDGGRIESAAALAAFLDRAEQSGAMVLDRTPVRALEPDGERVRVATDDETYDARVAVVAAGAWVQPLVGRLTSLPPLVVTQESVFHFLAHDPSPEWPSFILHGAGAGGTPVYGLETPGEGVKVAEHHAGPTTTADTRDFVVDASSRDRVGEVVRERLPGLHSTPMNEVTCLYTNTPDEQFVLERVGPLVVVSSCSGHGFKFAPEIGRRVADLAVS